MKILFRILSWLITLMLPLALTFLGLRLLLSHTFLHIEYRLPGFPVDPYGFTLSDRLQYASLALDYLLNEEDISFLSQLTFPDGSPLFNDRELSHMQDVKDVLRPVLVIGYSAWGSLLAFILGLGFGGGGSEMRNGLRRGGWLTVGLVALIGVFAALSFWDFFTVFHSLFFEGDSWLFYYSDTLIRLFPLRFWQDAFLFVGILDLASGLTLGLCLRPKASAGVSK